MLHCLCVDNDKTKATSWAVICCREVDQHTLTPTMAFLMLASIFHSTGRADDLGLASHAAARCHFLLFHGHYHSSSEESRTPPVTLRYPERSQVARSPEQTRSNADVVVSINTDNTVLGRETCCDLLKTASAFHARQAINGADVQGATYIPRENGRSCGVTTKTQLKLQRIPTPAHHHGNCD